MNICIHDLMICLLIRVPFRALKANVKYVDNFLFFPGLWYLCGLLVASVQEKYIIGSTRTSFISFVCPEAERSHLGRRRGGDIEVNKKYKQVKLVCDPYGAEDSWSLLCWYSLCCLLQFERFWKLFFHMGWNFFTAWLTALVCLVRPL